MNQKLVKYGWTYYFDGKEQLKIIPKEEDKKPIPETLYKYYALNDHSHEAINEKYIYGPHPDQFNDPFDSYHDILILNDPKKINFLFNISVEEAQEKIKNGDKLFLRDVQYAFKIRIFQKIGILSFIHDPSNLLMWSYYSNHEGYCMEFDYKKFPFKFFGPFQMNYQSNIEQISSEFIHTAFLYQTNIKSISWKHESEWRLLAEKNKIMEVPGIDSLKSENTENRKFHYNRENIKSITLGNRFFHNFNEIKIENEEGYINLKYKVDIKQTILNLIISEQIPVYIIIRDNFNLKRERIKIEKIEDCHYKMSMF